MASASAACSRPCATTLPIPTAPPPAWAWGSPPVPAAYVLKTAHAGQAGKLAHARVFGAPLSDGADLAGPAGEHARAGGLFQVQGAALKKIASAPVGEVVAIGKVEQAAAGELLGVGTAPPAGRPRRQRPALFTLAIAAANRKDDVRLSGALLKLVEEDPGLRVTHDPESRQVWWRGRATATCAWRSNA